MPNRWVRDGIVDSDKINRLSFAAEVFYRRLMSFADDFGLYYGETNILRAKLYALKPEVTEYDVELWIQECIKNDPGSPDEEPLLIAYESKGRRYLCITSFDQQKRSKPKFPLPPGLHPVSDNRPFAGSSVSDNRPFATANGHVVVVDNDNEIRKPVNRVTAIRPVSPPPLLWDKPDVSEIATALVKDLMGAHPEPSDRGLAITAAISELMTFSDPAQKAAAMRKTHATHARIFAAQRAQNGRAFVPSLQKWFASGVYSQTLAQPRGSSQESTSTTDWDAIPHGQLPKERALP